VGQDVEPVGDDRLHRPGRHFVDGQHPAGEPLVAVALAEVLARELRAHRIGVSVLCPMRVGTNIGNSERNRAADYGGPESSPTVPDQDEANADLAGRVLDVDDVAELTLDAISANRLYVLPHDESRDMIRRRFERIDRTFEQQPPVSGRQSS